MYENKIVTKIKKIDVKDKSVPIKEDDNIINKNRMGKTTNQNASGAPGIEPRWTSSAKSAVGTALSKDSHV